MVNFNSTMVRLKDYRQHRNPTHPPFQFHYGTIKSSPMRQEAIKRDKFQFHYGTIKRTSQSYKSTKKSNFNSTMVRLKEIQKSDSMRSCHYFNSTMVRLKVGKTFHFRLIVVFQFHYGTIKRQKQKYGELLKINFNSTMARLKGWVKIIHF